MLIRPTIPEEKPDPNNENILHRERHMYIYENTKVDFGVLGRWTGFGGRVPTLDDKYTQIAGSLVSQVTRVIIRGLPEDESPRIAFDRPKGERLTYAKCYYAHLSPNYLHGMGKGTTLGDIDLIPAFAASVGLTNTHIITKHGVAQATYFVSQVNYLRNDVFSFMDTLGIKSAEAIAGHTFLYVPEPTKYMPTITYKRLSEVRHGHLDSSLSVPKTYKLSEFEDSSTVLNLVTSKDSDLLETVEVFSHYEKLRENTLLLNDALIYIVKASLRSLLDEFTLIYDTKMGVNISHAKFPFQHDEVIREQLLAILNNIVLTFTLIGERISERLGSVRIMLNVNDIRHTVEIIFKDIHDDFGKPVHVRFSAPKMVCLNMFNLHHIYNTLTVH